MFILLCILLLHYYILILFYSIHHSDVKGRKYGYILTPLIILVVAIYARLVRMEPDVAIDDLKTSRSKTYCCKVYISRGFYQRTSRNPIRVL